MIFGDYKGGLMTWIAHAEENRTCPPDLEPLPCYHSEETVTEFLQRLDASLESLWRDFQSQNYTVHDNGARKIHLGQRSPIIAATPQLYAFVQRQEEDIGGMRSQKNQMVTRALARYICLEKSLNPPPSYKLHLYFFPKSAAGNELTTFQLVVEDCNGKFLQSTDIRIGDLADDLSYRLKDTLAKALSASFPGHR